MMEGMRTKRRAAQRAKPWRDRSPSPRVATWAVALGLWLVAALSAGPAAAGPAPAPRAAAKPSVPALPALPVKLWVAVEDGSAVVSDPWLEQQVAEAQRLLRPHGVQIEQVERAPLKAQFASLETPEHRDSLAVHLAPRTINVFVVRRLKDIDRPNRWIMGVRWRWRSNLRKDYVILSARALPTTLAHELGHYFGNPHSYVDNNIMSYQRSDPSAVCFDPSQGARMRRTVLRLVRTGRLITAAELARRRQAAVSSGQTPQKALDQKK